MVNTQWRVLARSGLNALLLIGFITGCGGGGGGGDGGAGPQANSGNLPGASSEALFDPLFSGVSGLYSFTTERVSGACTDGARIDTHGIALQILVLEDNGHIVLINQSAGPMVGVEVIEDAHLEGTVQSDGAFVAGSRVIARLDGVPGTVELLYSLEGRFVLTGWSGVYEYALRSDVLNITCFYRSDFVGERLAEAQDVQPFTLDEPWGPQDVYDSQRLIGRNP